MFETSQIFKKVVVVPGSDHYRFFQPHDASTLSQPRRRFRRIAMPDFFFVNSVTRTRVLLAWPRERAAAARRFRHSDCPRRMPPHSLFTFPGCFFIGFDVKSEEERTEICSTRRGPVRKAFARCPSGEETAPGDSAAAFFLFMGLLPLALLLLLSRRRSA